VAIDLGEPQRPKVVGSVAAPPSYEYTGRVQVDQHTLYATIAVGYDEAIIGIDVVDVSDPAALRRVTLIEQAGRIDCPDASFVASSGYLYTRFDTHSQRDGFWTLDMNEPAEPKVVGQHTSGCIGEVQGISGRVESGRFALMDHAFRLIDVSDLRRPREVVQAELPYWHLKDVSYRGPYVVFSGAGAGLVVGYVR
jgi:uncharacterized secreted protein with C-terminal beta-propeller domain